jgi:Flp pilus assembly pilin Flp
MVKGLLRCRRGAAAIEYCILAACIAVSLLAALVALGRSSSDAMDSARNGMHRGQDFTG